MASAGYWFESPWVHTSSPDLDIFPWTQCVSVLRTPLGVDPRKNLVTRPSNYPSWPQEVPSKG
ncbi:unnamed protein product [Ectocarpus sp. CCAP 1310/34]|nr:unnamed protein product [Ectocarpus sp. CCAP 1310/34]